MYIMSNVWSGVRKLNNIILKSDFWYEEISKQGCEVSFEDSLH